MTANTVVFIKGVSGNVAAVDSNNNLMVNIGSATINANISGDPVGISGQSVQITNVGSGLVGAVNTPTVDAIATNARAALSTIDYNHLYDRTNNVWNRAETDGTSGRGITLANVSGSTIKQQIPTIIITGTEVTLASLSGGTALPSGQSVSVTVKANAGNSGKVYLGGIGAQAPFSGKGLRMEPGDSYTAAVNNPAALQAFGTVSGDTISWIANQF